MTAIVGGRLVILALRGRTLRRRSPCPSRTARSQSPWSEYGTRLGLPARGAEDRPGQQHARQTVSPRGHSHPYISRRDDRRGVQVSQGPVCDRLRSGGPEGRVGGQTCTPRHAAASKRRKDRTDPGGRRGDPKPLQQANYQRSFLNARTSAKCKSGGPTHDCCRKFR